MSSSKIEVRTSKPRLLIRADVIVKTLVQLVFKEVMPTDVNSQNLYLPSRNPSSSFNFCKILTGNRKSRSSKPGSRDFLQQRIHRLEALVTDLAAQVRHSNSPLSNTESSQSPEQRTLDHSDVSSHT